LHSPSEEVFLVEVLGTALLVAGAAQYLQVSAAVGAFLVGVALSKPSPTPPTSWSAPCGTCSPVFFGCRRRGG
jgi:hypothetical protein